MSDTLTSATVLDVRGMTLQDIANRGDVTPTREAQQSVDVAAFQSSI